VEPKPNEHPLLAFADADRLPRTPPHPCPYLPDRVARERAFLADSLEPDVYHALMDRGFRRSGDLFYAADCPDCRLCVPLRVPVATFAPSRSQRRVLRRNTDIEVTVRAPQCTPEALAMYARYLRDQHGTVADAAELEQFRSSLYARVVDTREVVYSLAGVPIAHSLVDVCASSVSAVYHFYEPDHRDRSLGVFSVLAEIEWAARLGVPFYYLGYWIRGCRTMEYKANYGPHEVLRDGRWQPPE
jgi:arginyl-tRNA--protein-N-Asp/Glu arginylyltransferase